jgi:hypothetical protein
MSYERTGIDIAENRLRQNGNLLDILLSDRTSGSNIIWATGSYQAYGAQYAPDYPMAADQITGEFGKLIQPRSAKDVSEQRQRTKERGEVFTPLSVVSLMNSSLDDYPAGTEGSKVSWKEFVRERRLEVACGEAPFIVSRYDPSIEFSRLVEVKSRVGFLDKKLQVVSAMCPDEDEWIKWATEAFKSSYGYEWQGDSLLIGRENLLYSFIEHFINKFSEEPPIAAQESIADIISWNLFQMDGLKAVIPMSCHSKQLPVAENLTLQFFEELPALPQIEKCPGCEFDLVMRHNGLYVQIMDWETQKSERFVESIADKSA